MSSAPTPLSPASEAARWQRVKELFHAVVELPADERKVILDRETADDPSLRMEVASLLAVDGRTEAFIEEPAVLSVAESLLNEQESLTGSRAGAYRLEQELGHGGMGCVFLAVRDDDEFQNRAAVKVIRPDAATPAVARRFRTERQILAQLNHPNIATLLDGGTTGAGAPYLVMEYVEGRPLDVYARDRGLTVDERLRLFLKVLSAVQYAHQRLIVHRDLKPANVLVTEDGTPKLLDFGIAKLFDADGSSEQTGVELRALTPDYASPEQISGEPIGTASDVYSLGVLLYELLTGHKPYDVGRRSHREQIGIVCNTEPKRPSKWTDAEPSARRRDARIGADLDTIVLKAMAKEPARRYSSVEQFANDVTRYLEGRPIMARRSTVAYRTGKFIRRNPVGVSAAVLLVVTLIGGVVATTREARIAATERARAERRFQDVRELANSVIFELQPAIEQLPGSTKARELLVRRAVTYLDRLRSEERTDRALMHEIAAAYLRLGDVEARPNRANLGNTDRADSSYRKAHAILQSLASSANASRGVRIDHAIAWSRLGDTQMRKGDMDAAVRSQRNAVRLLEPLAAGDARAEAELANAYGRLASAVMRAGSVAEAVVLQRKSIELLEGLTQRQQSVERSRELASALGGLGGMLVKVGKGGEAEEVTRRALNMADALAREDALDFASARAVAVAHTQLGDLLVRRGDVPRARQHFEASVAVRQRSAGADPENAQAQRDLALGLSRLGRLSMSEGQLDDALRYFSDALAISERLARHDRTNSRAQRDLSTAYTYLGDLNWERRDFATALKYYQQDLLVTEPLRAKDPGSKEAQRDVLISHERLAYAYEHMKDHRRALESRQKVLELAMALAAADRTNDEYLRSAGGAHASLARLYLENGRTAEGEHHAALARATRIALHARNQSDANAARDLAESEEMHGEQLLRAGKAAEAIVAFESALRLLEASAKKGKRSPAVRVAEAKLYGHLGAAHERLAENREAGGAHLQLAKAFYHRSAGSWKELEAANLLPLGEESEPARARERLRRAPSGARRCVHVDRAERIQRLTVVNCMAPARCWCRLHNSRRHNASSTFLCCRTCAR